jgi:hypothetical protein
MFNNCANSYIECVLISEDKCQFKNSVSVSSDIRSFELAQLSKPKFVPNSSLSSCASEIFVFELHITTESNREPAASGEVPVFKKLFDLTHSRLITLKMFGTEYKLHSFLICKLVDLKSRYCFSSFSEYFSFVRLHIGMSIIRFFLVAVSILFHAGWLWL